MTWNHPRGIDPLVAHAHAWRESHGVEISWDARLLEDFEAFPLDDLAAKYDLMVIDHPHVGMAAASGCLLPFDPALHYDTVGRSHESYFYQGRQWALAIDAAAQVSARRAGSIETWPTTWDEVFDLARTGRVLCPLAPVHAMMCFYTLCANSGRPCATEGSPLIPPDIAQNALARLKSFAALLPPFCFELNPIGVFERMVADGRFIYSPLIYGYVSYGRDDFRATRIEFGEIPDIRGSALGGTGIAVSERSRHRDEAVAVAVDLASSATQRTLYASSGGQPAHRDAWTDDRVNAATHDFYRSTLATLDRSYLRPRFDGYIPFQQAAGEAVAACVRGDATPAATADGLNLLFAEAQRPK